MLYPSNLTLVFFGGKSHLVIFTMKEIPEKSGKSFKMMVKSHLKLMAGDRDFNNNLDSYLENPRIFYLKEFQRIAVLFKLLNYGVRSKYIV